MPQHTTVRSPLTDVIGQAAVGRVLHVVPAAHVAQHHHHGAAKRQHEVVQRLYFRRTTAARAAAGAASTSASGEVGGRVPQQDDLAVERAGILASAGLTSAAATASSRSAEVTTAAISGIVAAAAVAGGCVGGLQAQRGVAGLQREGVQKLSLCNSGGSNKNTSSRSNIDSLSVHTQFHPIPAIYGDVTPQHRLLAYLVCPHSPSDSFHTKQISCCGAVIVAYASPIVSIPSTNTTVTVACTTTITIPQAEGAVI